jgi:hypothetical protein
MDGILHNNLHDELVEEDAFEATIYLTHKLSEREEGTASVLRAQRCSFFCWSYCICPDVQTTINYRLLLYAIIRSYIWLHHHTQPLLLLGEKGEGGDHPMGLRRSQYGNPRDNI